MIIDTNFKDRFMLLNQKVMSMEISHEEFKTGLINIVEDVEKYRIHKLRKEKLLKLNETK